MINYIYKGQCTNVVDGDTIDVTIDLGFRMTTHQRLRLLGVDCFEFNSKDELERLNAADAKTFVINTVLNKPVWVETKKSDSFGRYLATVYYIVPTMAPGIGIERSLNADLIQQGLATVWK